MNDRRAASLDYQATSQLPSGDQEATAPHEGRSSDLSPLLVAALNDQIAYVLSV